MTSSTRSSRAWWFATTDAYARAILVLGLNIPFLLLALIRYLGGTDPTSITGAYALLTALGYWAARDPSIIRFGKPLPDGATRS